MRTLSTQGTVTHKKKDKKNYLSFMKCRPSQIHVQRTTVAVSTHAMIKGENKSLIMIYCRNVGGWARVLSNSKESVCTHTHTHTHTQTHIHTHTLVSELWVVLCDWKDGAIFLHSSFLCIPSSSYYCECSRPGSWQRLLRLPAALSSPVLRSVSTGLSSSLSWPL